MEVYIDQNFLIAYQAGVSPLLQHQFEELVKQKGTVQDMGDNKRRKLSVIGQDLIEPLQALRTGGQQVMSNILWLERFFPLQISFL